MAIVHFITFGCVFSSSSFLDKKYLQSQIDPRKLLTFPSKWIIFSPNTEFKGAADIFASYVMTLSPSKSSLVKSQKSCRSFRSRSPAQPTCPRNCDQIKFSKELWKWNQSLKTGWFQIEHVIQWDRPSATYPHSQSMINGNTTLSLMWGIFITNTMLLFMMMVVTSKLPITAITKKILTLTTFCNDPPLGKSSKKKWSFLGVFDQKQKLKIIWMAKYVCTTFRKINLKTFFGGASLVTIRWDFCQCTEKPNWRLILTGQSSRTAAHGSEWRFFALQHVMIVMHIRHLTQKCTTRFFNTVFHNR